MHHLLYGVSGRTGARYYRFSRALRVRVNRSSISSARGRLGAPRGYFTLVEANIRLTPTEWATGTMLQTCTVGILAFSSSLVITAPQRVLVPQVEVSTAASMLFFLMYSAIALPILRLFSVVVIKPVVPR